MSKDITHDGIVIDADGTQVTVRFVQHSACSDCHARALCSNSSDSAAKTAVAQTEGVAYAVGDAVTLIVDSGSAWRAVLFAFVVPMVLSMAMLFVVKDMMGEMWACLATLAFIAVYYLLLYGQRHRLERRVVFRVRHRVA